MQDSWVEQGETFEIVKMKGLASGVVVGKLGGSGLH